MSDALKLRHWGFVLKPPKKKPKPWWKVWGSDQFEDPVPCQPRIGTRIFGDTETRAGASGKIANVSRATFVAEDGMHVELEGEPADWFADFAKAQGFEPTLVAVHKLVRDSMVAAEDDLPTVLALKKPAALEPTVQPGPTTVRPKPPLQTFGAPTTPQPGGTDSKPGPKPASDKPKPDPGKKA